MSKYPVSGRKLFSYYVILRNKDGAAVMIPNGYPLFCVVSLESMHFANLLLLLFSTYKSNSNILMLFNVFKKPKFFQSYLVSGNTNFNLDLCEKLIELIEMNFKAHSTLCKLFSFLHINKGPRSLL